MRTTTICKILKSAANKLNSYGQSLKMQPDYGEMSNRLYDLQKQLKESMMFKIVPMQNYDDQVPSGMVIPIEIFEDDSKAAPVLQESIPEDNMESTVSINQRVCPECQKHIPCVIEQTALDLPTCPECGQSHE